MTLHLVGLPHTETVAAEYSWCAYTERVRKFMAMMTPRGHDIVLYGGQRNDAPVKEHVVILDDDDRHQLCGDYRTAIPFDRTHPAFSVFNERAADEIEQRLDPANDLVLVTGGSAQQPIAENLPAVATIVEWGVGYAGTFSDFRVFESHAWRHHICGVQGGYDPDGRFYDAVIPNFFDPADFEVGEPDGYFLFLGRMIDRKGPSIAEKVCEHLGLPLVFAGEGDYQPSYGTHVGHVNPAQRRALLSGAVATFAPTWYIEPFGGVAVEALMSGVPVISTDFGAFTETIRDGDGWRCRTMAEFAHAAEMAYDTAALHHERHARRDRALDRFSLDAVAPQYERYFDQLHALQQGRDWNWMPEAPCLS